MAKSFKARAVFKNAFRLVLVIIFLLQVYKSVEKYLDGLPSTSVSFVEELSIEMPAVTICITDLENETPENTSKTLEQEYEDKRNHLDSFITNVMFSDNFREEGDYLKYLM